MEEILSVDLSTRVGVTADTALLNKADRAFQMKQRAQEEIEIVKEDMKRSANFYTAEHSLLLAHLKRILSAPQTTYSKGCTNLLSHHLLQCEITLTLFSKMFQPYISYEYPMCSLISSIHNSSTLDTANVDDESPPLSEDSSDSESFSESSTEDYSYVTVIPYSFQSLYIYIYIYIYTYISHVQ